MEKLSETKILEKINETLAKVSYPNHPKGLYEPIKYVLSIGGKRLRPTLLLLAYSLYRQDIENALPAAIAIETYHNHTLLHDDLMDRADMRRGHPTVHKRWNDNTAVLSGDTMLILAFKHLIKYSSPHSIEILQLFAQTAQEICEGQQYDVNFEQQTDVSEAEYLEMIRLKTSVLLACSVKMGALLADASAEDAETLYRFAEKIGLAFQLQDDWLDVYGDPLVFGKKIGGDIVCGKKTFLLINAFNKANNEQRTYLQRTLSNQEIPANEKIIAVTHLYNQLGVSDYTLQTIERFYLQAFEEIKKLSLPEAVWRPLWLYTKSLLGRNK